ncbi:MAG: RsmB/NOP family class I SAM-dependent RNA methyltransferase [Lachnospiraceae bacterium]|jgi:NOL1/NOP2/sun family putative RNA methylase|nr:RsmB/NOP family class I SAM-dependent RNA methyltransferase [Lachnospiraceae bacterium]
MELPAGFERRMRTLLGSEYEAFAASFDKEQDRALRVNTLKIAAPDFLRLAGGTFGLRKVPWTENGFYYAAADRPGRHPWHEAGLYYIQEPSAMAVAELSGAEPGERVLDLCAAPGGKTTAVAAMLRGEGLLVANEIHPVRAKALSQNVERMGIANALVVNEDPSALALRFPGYFDRVLVDAPCSGEGMFRREEHALTDWSEENIARCAARQDGILDAADAMLSDGGTIVYSTCTFAPEEDEGSVTAFLERHPDYHVLPLSFELAADKSGRYEGFAPGHPEWAEWGVRSTLSGTGAAVHRETAGEAMPQEAAGAAVRQEVAGAVRLWPHRTGGAGHFLCLLKKNGVRAPKVCTDPVRTAGKPEQKMLADFCREALRPGALDLSPARVIAFGDELYQLPDAVSTDGLRVLRPGLDLGTLKKGRFEPAHALALHIRPDGSTERLELSSGSPEAVQYLQGLSLRVSPSGGSGEKEMHGWTLVTADGFGFGWGKAAGGVLKNHYPKGLRW